VTSVLAVLLLGLLAWNAMRARVRRVQADLAARVTELHQVNDALRREIGERQRVEQSLRESEARWHAVSELTSDWAYCCRREDSGPPVLEWVTGAFNRLTGFTVEEIRRRGGLRTLFHPDDRAALDEVLASLDGARQIVEARIVTRAGETRWVAHHGPRVGDGPQRGIVRFYGAVQDITIRKHTEEAKGRLAAIVESSSDAIIAESLEGVILSWNEGAERLFGYRPDEVLGHTLARLIPAERADDLRRLLDAVRRDHRCEHLETVRLRRDGSPIPVSLTISPIRAESGEVIGMSEIARDVTQRRALEVEREQLLARAEAARADAEVAQRRAERQAAELAAQADELRQAHEAALESARLKSEFLANMSHEIRTPMNAILGYTEMLACPETTEPERADSLATIRWNGEHLLRIINDVLDLSKIEAGKLAVERVQSAPVELVSEVLSLLQVPASEKGILLDVEYRTPVPARIWTDPTRFCQILTNLIGNAVKFTQRGGVRVRVKTEMAEPASRLCIEVTDTGIGMEAETVERLFTAFTQADASTTRQFGGTGLGLAISKRLAQMLGGDIQVRSVTGQGSTFVLDMEMEVASDSAWVEPEAAQAWRPSRPAAPEPPERVKGRVLLVEDTPDSQRLIAYHLRKAGAEVEVASDGGVAYQLAATASRAGTPFDAVLMDMQMPRIDGYTATRLFRQAGYRGRIIALTAYAMPGDRAKCLHAGCDEYLSKPVDRRTLIQVVSDQLQGRPATPVSAAAAGHTGAAAPGPAEPDPVDDGPELVSTLGDDPDVLPLVEAFVQRLPERVAAMEATLRQRDLAALAVQAHQLKGTAGGYGFPGLSDAAGGLEQAARAHAPLVVVRERTQRVATLCRRARAAASASPAPLAGLTAAAGVP
jgi:PAS domain S-box-containing protein